MCIEAANAKEQNNDLCSPPISTCSNPDFTSSLGDISLSSPLSKLEATHYYTGLPSTPILIARTSNTSWKKPTSPEDDKELRPVGNHAIKNIWESNLAHKVHACLNSAKVQWTSTDVVRIGKAGESFAPVILWIGVEPTSLSGYDGLDVASKCKELLVECHITDVDVEIRASSVTRSMRPRFLAPTSSSDHTVDVREAVTTTLGLPICAESTPWDEGTAGLFIRESKRLLLVTARHVVFPPPDDNKYFEYKNDSESKTQPRHNVALFGFVAFKRYIRSFQARIGAKAITAQHCEGQIKVMEREPDKERQEIQARLEEAKQAIQELWKFWDTDLRYWCPLSYRILGHVILSPPISISIDGYTEDWAAIEVDTSKIDADNFDGNVIDLGTDKLTGLSTHPHDRFLRLQGTIPEEEMRCPTTFGQNDEDLMVLKRGNTTGLTVGRANDVFSYIRTGQAGVSKEWAILPSGSKSGAFSAKGDSGSVIVDGRGRIGGLLTGGSGDIPCLDITYATPMTFLLKSMSEKGLDVVLPEVGGDR
ncbi:hypothetical protein VNI00_006323 [Paramarasmius palmivorus]|uniref:Uncharacterized protein n=1 Tax=Paramarasmius palmivorus TaxID=297713 RepID=A0AAW0D7J3_9AGAR